MKKSTTQRGYIFLGMIVIFMVTSLAIVLGTAGPTARYIKASNDLLVSKESYYAAEAVSEDAFFRLKNNVPISFPRTQLFGNATVTVDQVVIGANARDVLATSSVSGIIRTVYKGLTVTDGFSFNYGVQMGIGGVTMNGGSKIIGNVYSNGTVIGAGSGGNGVAGTVVSAGDLGNVSGINATGSVYAKNISSTKVCGDAYYQTIDSSSLSYLNAPTSGLCGLPLTPGTGYPNSTPQEHIAFPISDELMQTWQNDAEAGGVITSPCPYAINSTRTIGPVKINCDVVFSGNNTVVTLAGNVWVNGNVTIQNSVDIKIAGNIGNKNVAIIADKPTSRTTSGKFELQNNSRFFGAPNNPDSYVMLISRNTSAANGGSAIAIDVSNGASGEVLVYAPYGTIQLSNNVTLKEVTAHKLVLNNNSEVIYKAGLAQQLFTSGPSGTWKVGKWRER